MSDPTARTLALLSLLQTHRHWSGDDLADRLGVSVRTVRRDVDRLRLLGYQVDAASGLEGGYRLAAGASLPPLLVDDDEAVALAVGLGAASGAAIEGIDEVAVRLLAKLDRVLPDRLQRRVEALHSNTEVLRWAPDTFVPAATLTLLAQACRDREEVRFDYTRRDGESARRLVRPHQLVSVGHRWYVVAFDVRRDDWRTFRVDRMEEPALAGVRFAPLDLPAESSAEFVAAGLRASRQQLAATVELTGDPAEIERFARWFEVELTHGADGTTVAVVRAEAAEWLASLVAILATTFDVRLLDATDEVREHLDRAATRLGAIRDAP